MQQKSGIVRYRCAACGFSGFRAAIQNQTGRLSCQNEEAQTQLRRDMRGVRGTTLPDDDGARAQITQGKDQLGFGVSGIDGSARGTRGNSEKRGREVDTTGQDQSNAIRRADSRTAQDATDLVDGCPQVSE